MSFASTKEHTWRWETQNGHLPPPLWIYKRCCPRLSEHQTTCSHLLFNPQATFAKTMPSYESFSFSQLDSSFRPKSPVQSQDLPRTSPELTIKYVQPLVISNTALLLTPFHSSNTLNSRTGGHPSYAPDRAVIPWTACVILGIGCIQFVNLRLGFSAEAPHI